MHLYRIHTRQTHPVNSEHYSEYYVWADSVLSAEAALRRKLSKRVVFTTTLRIYDDYRDPIIMLGV